MKLSVVNIKSLARSRLISRYYNEIILNNEDLRFTLILMGQSQGENESLAWKFQFNCKVGNLELCQWMMKKFEFSLEEIKFANRIALKYACKNSNNSQLKIANWLVKTFNLTIEDVRDEHNFNYILKCACKHGNLEVCKWLEKTFRLSGPDARIEEFFIIISACESGNLEVAKWMKNTFNLSEEDSKECGIQSLHSAITCKNDTRLEICKWVVKAFNLTKDDIKYCPCNIFRTACCYGHLSLAAESSSVRLDVLRWLHSTFNIIKEDIRGWNSEIIPSIFEGEIPDSSCLEILKWLHEIFHIDMDDLEFENGANALLLACECGYLETARWLKETFNVDSNYIRKDNNIIIRSSCYSGNLEVCKWLVNTFNLTIKDLILDERDNYNIEHKFGYTRDQLKTLKFMLDRDIL